MANIKINKVEYSDVPQVDVPNTDGGVASFYEVSGELDVSENGSYDVTSKSSVNVNVEGSGGLTWDEVVSGTTEEITLNTTTSIPSYTFYNTSGVKKINSPLCTSVGGGSMQRCTNLTNFTSAPLEKVGINAFEGCEKLEVVSLSDTVCSIETSAFSGCSSLKNANLEATTGINSYSFYKCASLQSATLGKESYAPTFYIGYASFRGCTSLRTVKFNSQHPVISGDQAFTDCTSLVEVVFPGTFKSSVYNTFNGCTSLKTLYYTSKNTSTVGPGSFFGASALVAFVLTSTKGAWYLPNVSAFNNTPIASGTGYIYVPEALLDTYKTATNWVTYADQFRALEQYTVDGTTTGELDESKI